jgi:ABC-2 type transport system ATP-binding protein
MKALLSTLNVETFVFDLASGANKIDIPDFTCRAVDDQTLEVDVPKDSGLNVVFEAFSRQKVKVMSMRNKANRLEELFVRLVKSNNPQNTIEASKEGATA